MCGGFTCSKIILYLINILFVLVSFVLIGVGSYAVVSTKIASIELAGGIITCGLVLLLVAVLGLFAGAKHHQVLLFFYIVILALLFVIQFSVSVACLAVPAKQVESTVSTLWLNNTLNNDTKSQAEQLFHCCAWHRSEWNGNWSGITVEEECRAKFLCNIVKSKTDSSSSVACSPCSEVIPKEVNRILEANGGIGLFFSFTEMLAIWLAIRYRNQKDPRGHLNKFL